MPTMKTSPPHTLLSTSLGNVNKNTHSCTSTVPGGATGPLRPAEEPSAAAAAAAAAGGGGTGHAWHRNPSALRCTSGRFVRKELREHSGVWYRTRGKIEMFFLSSALLGGSSLMEREKRRQNLVSSDICFYPQPLGLPKREKPHHCGSLEDTLPCPLFLPPDFCLFKVTKILSRGILRKYLWGCLPSNPSKVPSGVPFGYLITGGQSPSKHL